MSDDNATRLIPLSQWSKLHGWPSEAGLRNLITHKELNGFAVVVKKVGKRVLIDEQAFFKWVEQQQ